MSLRPARLALTDLRGDNRSGGTDRVQNYNRGIIEEFRVNEGRVGGPFAGAPMVLVTSMGANGGRLHKTRLGYLRGDDASGGPGESVYVFCSMGAARKQHAWYDRLQ